MLENIQMTALLFLVASWLVIAAANEKNVNVGVKAIILLMLFGSAPTFFVTSLMVIWS